MTDNCWMRSESLGLHHLDFTMPLLASSRCGSCGAWDSEGQQWQIMADHSAGTCHDLCLLFGYGSKLSTPKMDGYPLTMIICVGYLVP